MGFVEEYLPVMAMSGIQVIYAVMTLISRAALLKGMSPRVFVVYRQAIATIFLAPIAYFSRLKSSTRVSLNLKSFSLIFVAALIGATMNQNVYFEGVLLASSSMATAMTNLIPAVTFVIAAIFRMERVKNNLRSLAKIGGTVICVSGAMCMAFLRGRKLLNATQGFGLKSTLFGLETGNDRAWLLGCLCLFGDCCFWAIWLILQIPALESYPDKLCLSAWTCFISLIQSIMFALIVEGIDPERWIINSSIGIISFLFAGIFGSGVAYFLQAWCISKKGPVFSAVFFPLSTIITTILSAIFLHEEIYIGSMLGAVIVIIGLYIVLWGKAKDYVKEEGTENQSVGIEQEDCESASTETSGSKIDLEEPLLSKECIRQIDN